MPVLKFDIDGKIDWKRMKAVVRMFGLEIDFADSKWAKTKHGFHIYLGVGNVLSEEGICFLQIAGGSDWKRECLNWLRITKGFKWQKESWNVLFSKKYAVGLDGKVMLTSEEKELPIWVLRRRLDVG